MDLGQVEVIKGVASALYGAGAMGGVINLLSRRPDAEPGEEFLLNRSTRGATDAVTFLSRSFARGWSGSLLGGGHWQETNDVDDDAWADLPGYSRGVVRPRVFWDGGGGRTFSRQPALRTRIARAARQKARCSRPLASLTSKPSRRDGTTPVLWASS